MEARLVFTWTASFIFPPAALKAVLLSRGGFTAVLALSHDCCACHAACTTFCETDRLSDKQSRSETWRRDSRSGNDDNNNEATTGGKHFQRLPDFLRQNWKRSHSPAAAARIPTCIVLSNINPPSGHPGTPSCQWDGAGQESGAAHCATSTFSTESSDQMVVKLQAASIRWREMSRLNQAVPVRELLTKSLFFHHTSGGGLSSGIFQGSHPISSSTPFNPAQQVSRGKGGIISKGPFLKESWGFLSRCY